MEKLNVEDIKKLVKKFRKTGQTISIMESCTGGGLANAITNVQGASEVFEYGVVAYSNAAKITVRRQKNARCN